MIIPNIKLQILNYLMTKANIFCSEFGYFDILEFICNLVSVI